jgi:perosamine synthetase
MIPVCSPYLNGNEKKYVNDALDTNWISSTGKYVKMFEDKFAEYCGVKHGITTTNGTTALHLALTSLGIGKGDEVIIPNFTMIASAFAVCYTGAKPVFVDADPNTWNINTNLIEEKINIFKTRKKNCNGNIEEKITKRTKAIMPVHIYGLPCDMNPINEIAKKHNLYVIEDSAEAHGAEYFGKKAGNLGDISAFSFFSNKVQTCGEGGMVVTNNDELAEKCRYYKNLCFPRTDTRIYSHEDIGFNYRLSNLHSAIGLAQTEKADEYVNMRIKNNNLYRMFLSEVDGITFQPKKDGFKNVAWMNAILIDKDKFGMDRDSLEKILREHGVETRRFFVGMNRQKSLINYGCSNFLIYKGDGMSLGYEEKFPVSDYLSENGLYLPSGSNLTEEEIKNVCVGIRNPLKWRVK